MLCELVELVLELGQGVRDGADAEPTFECLMEAFDLALCLRVPG